MSTAGAFLRKRAGRLVCAALPVLAASCSGRHDGGDPGVAHAVAAPAARHHVTLHAVQFDPPSLTVAIGDTVEWDNHDLVPHTSTATDRTWNSGSIAPDSSWSVVIARAGVFPYGCSFHPAMKAQIVVGLRGGGRGVR